LIDPASSSDCFWYADPNALRTDAGTGTGGLADEAVLSGRMRRSERMKEKRTPSSGVRGDGAEADSSGSGLVDFEILARHHD